MQRQRRRPSFASFLAIVTLFASEVSGQARNEEGDVSRAVAGLELRGIGPAVMGGRIADIAVDPRDRSTWFVAAGSGGLWKTTNSGVTWTPIFDSESSYSIGVVTLDPGDPKVVWVGTGENVSGRHVGWGSGVYRSRDAGRTWERLGLHASQHIGRILVDPRDGNVVYVASEGPLWSPGGERGVYKSTDGGESWRQVLGISENTGVTDMEFHPTDPDVVYAAAYQRRRHTWAFLAGGPESGIYKSSDGGESWRRLETGLPRGDMGKIGLAVTPADPDLVYATVEAKEADRGFYRSGDKGESWEQRNSYISGGTGPHYYQEIEASPTDPDLIYQMDVFLQVTRDGGRSFGILETGREKHSDNHALWIDPKDGRHLLVGTDAGLYESFDDGSTWRHFPNLPVSQFYHLALSNSEPFYEILGGAQDLGTLLGPARTGNAEGVRNRDWYAPLGADGYHVAIDPDDPNILYLETQVGNLHRYDRRSEEALHIQPQPAPGDPPERWNWDSPILISPHAPNRLYVGSQRLWRSEDRGDSWEPVSDDLTTNRNRYELEFMGRVWSVDDLYDNGAMSQYATLTTLTESPVHEGTIFTGSDDGLVHVTEDGGGAWRRAAELPGVPALAFINDLEASWHDPATVFVAADGHKTGDYSPYLFRSRDGGRSWISIRGDLPEETIVWAIQQDHVDPDLLFIGTEFGLFFTPNGGTNWHKLNAGVPTIAFRDIRIHRRDQDLVGATFGRGFYVLDDYTPLREIASGALGGGSALFPVRDAWWYIPSVPMQARGKPTLGSDDFTGENPPFGAVFTFFLTDLPQTLSQERGAVEERLRGEGADVPFPGWERLREEGLESGPRVFLVVRNAGDEAVRWVPGPARAGIHRVSWDLRGPPPDPVDLSTPGFVPPWSGPSLGPLVPPGRYSVELMLVSEGEARVLGTRREFQVKPVPTAPPGTDFEAVAAFQWETSELRRRISGAGEELGQARERLRYMREALNETPRADPSLFGRLDALARRLDDLRTRLQGDRVRGALNEPSTPSVSARVGQVIGGHWETRQTPTATQRANVEIASREFAELSQELRAVIEGDLPRLEEALEEAGAPWTPGRLLSGGGQRR